MNSKSLLFGILTVMLTINIISITYNTAIAQTTNATQGNATLANMTHGNMTQQNLSTDEATQLIRENSAIDNGNQENEDDADDNGN